MKNTNAVRTEIHYAQVGEYQLPLLTLPQTCLLYTSPSPRDS